MRGSKNLIDLKNPGVGMRMHVRHAVEDPR